MRNTEVYSRRYRALGPVAVLALLLGGCASLQHLQTATASSPPATGPCVDPTQIPAEPPMVGQKFNGDAKHDLQVLAPNAKALREWGEQLHSMLRACAPQPAAPAVKP